MNMFKNIIKNLVVMMGLMGASSLCASQQPNVILIVCDDLNDYLGSYEGHPPSDLSKSRRFCQVGSALRACLFQQSCLRPF